MREVIGKGGHEGEVIGKGHINHCDRHAAFSGGD